MSNSSFVRLAAIGALALSFALTACGRKGALDLPPRASAQPAQQQQQQQAPQQQAGVQGDQQADSSRSQWNPFGSSGGDDLPPPPQGQKKPFILDGLLN